MTEKIPVSAREAQAGKLKTGMDHAGARQFLVTSTEEVPLYCGTRVIFNRQQGRYEASFCADGQAIIAAYFCAEKGGREELAEGDEIILLHAVS